jgi:hypothetical protein
MSLLDLLPTVRSLPRDDQVRLMHYLIDLTRPKGSDGSEMNHAPVAYEVFSPEPCAEAAEALLKLLTDPRSTT